MKEPVFAVGKRQISGADEWNIYMAPSLKHAYDLRDEFTIAGTPVSRIAKINMSWHDVFERVARYALGAGGRNPLDLSDYNNNEGPVAILLYTTKTDIFPEVGRLPLHKTKLRQPYKRR